MNADEHPPADVRRLAASQVSERAPELVELQRRAYRIEAQLIGDDRIPQLTETAEELVAAGLTWFVALGGDGEIVGALACSGGEGVIEDAGAIDEGSVIDIERLAVDPGHHRRGVARRLLDALPAGPAVVSTGRDNTPARRLYRSEGFTHAGGREVLPGLWISTYLRP